MKFIRILLYSIQKYINEIILFIILIAKYYLYLLYSLGGIFNNLKMIKKIIKGYIFVSLVSSCGFMDLDSKTKSNLSTTGKAFNLNKKSQYNTQNQETITSTDESHSNNSSNLDNKLQLNIPPENIHGDGGKCKIIGNGNNKYVCYEVGDNEIITNVTENCCWKALSEKYNNNKALNFEDKNNKCAALFNKNLSKDYSSTGMGAVVGSMPQIQKDIIKLRKKLDADGLPMPIIPDNPRVKVAYSLFSMQSEFENEFKKYEHNVNGKRLKFITPKDNNGSCQQVMGIYDNRCDELGQSKCRCQTSDDFDQKIANNNKKTCPILRDGLNKKPSWIKLLKFKDKGNKNTNYLCFVAYGFNDTTKVIEEIQKGYPKYKNSKDYNPRLYGEFIFPQLAFKTLNLNNSFMKDRIFDKNSGILGIGTIEDKRLFSWVSDVLIQLDEKGVIAKAQTEMMNEACCPPGLQKNPIKKCKIDCIATKIDKKHPCYLCIFHENSDGEIILDLSTKITNPDKFVPAA